MTDSRIIGLMRFSLITERNRVNWKQTRGQTVDEAAALIMAPARLDRRMALFENLPLRSLDHQTRRDFQLIVMTSTLLPKPYKRRLKQLAEERDYLVIKKIPPHRAIKDAARQAIEDRTGRLTTFRIDDDDAVDDHYIERLHSFATAANEGKIVSFQRGYGLQAEGAGFLLQETVYPKIALGLASIANDGLTIFDKGSHSQIDRFPMIFDDTPGAWIRLLHNGSDSGARIDRGRPAIHCGPQELAAHAPGFGRLDFQAVHDALARTDP